MTSPENILLRLSPRDDVYVRELFEHLEGMGFPKQNQSPHISVTFARQMQPQVVERAKDILPGCVPATLRRAGVVTFGVKRKQTVAWLLEGSDELETAARELSALNPEGRGSRWIPHLTLGLRLPREIVPDYIRALDELTSPHFRELTAEQAVYWRPQLGEEVPLAPA